MPWYRFHSERKPVLENLIFDRFATLFMKNSAPREMLLLRETHRPLVSTLWIRLSDEMYYASFREFEPAHPYELPERVTLLIGNRMEFESLFERGLSA